MAVQVPSPLLITLTTSILIASSVELPLITNISEGLGEGESEGVGSKVLCASLEADGDALASAEVFGAGEAENSPTDWEASGEADVPG